RARELEAAEAGVAGAMEDDGVRRPASRAHELAVDRDPRELSTELQDERVDPLVGDEQVRAEPDRRDPGVVLRRPPERLVQLVEALRPRQRPRRAAGAERRVARERDVLLELHESSATSK